jgi:hypothetical protein
MVMRYMGGGVGHLNGDVPPTTQVRHEPEEPEGSPTKNASEQSGSEGTSEEDSGDDDSTSHEERNSDEDGYASLS